MQARVLPRYIVCLPGCDISGRGLPLPISRLQLVNPS